MSLNSRPASGRLATNRRDPRHVVNRVVREAHTKEPLGSSEKSKYYEYYVDESDLRSKPLVISDLVRKLMVFSNQCVTAVLGVFHVFAAAFR